MNIQSGNHKTKKHFDKIAGDFFKRAWVSTNEKAEAFREAIHELIPGIKNKRILEVGVGAGSFAQILTNEHHNYFGVDISPLMLKKASMVLPKDNLYQGDGENLNFFSDDMFDLVCCRNVIKHVSRPLKMLQEMKRVCRPKCEVLIVESCGLDQEDVDFFSRITAITEPTQKPYMLLENFLNFFDLSEIRNTKYKSFGFIDRSTSDYLDTFHLSEEEKEKVWDIYRNASQTMKEKRMLKQLEEEPGFEIYFHWVAVTGEK